MAGSQTKSGNTEKNKPINYPKEFSKNLLPIL